MTTEEPDVETTDATDEDDIEYVDAAWSRVGGAQLVALLLVVALVAGLVGWWAGRRDDGGVPGASSVDVGFMHDMIDHHDQAVQMSLYQLSNGTPEGPMGFAKDVIVTQRYEIGVMEGWLRRWGYERADLDRDDAMAWMGMAVPAAQMPGMATEAQIDALRTGEGRAADTAFFDLMIAHHRGGIHMANYAARYATDARVRTLARGMAANQTLEVQEMLQARQRLGV